MDMVVFPIKLYLQTLKFEWHMLCVLKCYSSFDFFSTVKDRKSKKWFAGCKTENKNMDEDEFDPSTCNLANP